LTRSVVLDSNASDNPVVSPDATAKLSALVVDSEQRNHFRDVLFAVDAAAHPSAVWQNVMPFGASFGDESVANANREW
jgi:hypothetical protein